MDPSTTDTERRRHPRRPASLTARLLRDDEELGRLSTRDLSLGGVYLRRGNGPAPPMGAEVAVELESEDGSGSRLVRARVVRVTDLGIALAFLDNEP